VIGGRAHEYDPEGEEEVHSVPIHLGPRELTLRAPFVVMSGESRCRTAAGTRVQAGGKRTATLQATTSAGSRCVHMLTPAPNINKRLILIIWTEFS
jgi:hypothetical protein